MRSKSRAWSHWFAPCSCHQQAPLLAQPLLLWKPTAGNTLSVHSKAIFSIPTDFRFILYNYVNTLGFGCFLFSLCTFGCLCPWGWHMCMALWVRVSGSTHYLCQASWSESVPDVCVFVCISPCTCLTYSYGQCLYIHQNISLTLHSVCLSNLSFPLLFTLLLSPYLFALSLLPRPSHQSFHCLFLIFYLKMNQRR